MSIFGKVLPRQPHAWLAGWLAAGFAVLLLAHPGFYAQGSVYPAVVAAVALASIVALASGRPGPSAWRPPWSMTWPALAIAVAAGQSVLANAADPWPLWLLTAQLLFAWTGWWLAPDSRAVGILARTLLAGGALAGFYGLLQYLQLDPLPPATRFADRVVSLFDNPNHFANFAACALPLALAGYLRRGRLAPVPWLWWGLVGLVYAGLLMAASRAAWVASACGGLLVLAGYARSLRSDRLPARPVHLGALAALLVAVTCLIGLRPVLRGPTGPISLRERAYSASRVVGPGEQLDSTVRHRYFLWQVTWDMIRSHPLSGIGYGAYPTRFAAYRDARRGASGFEQLSWEQRREVTPYAHNEYLHLWAETGPLGLVGLGALLAVGLARGMRRAWDAGCERLLLWGALGSAVSMLVDSLASYPLHLPLNGMIFWVLFGISSNGDMSRLDEDPAT